MIELYHILHKNQAYSQLLRQILQILIKNGILKLIIMINTYFEEMRQTILQDKTIAKTYRTVSLIIFLLFFGFAA